MISSRELALFPWSVKKGPGRTNSYKNIFSIIKINQSNGSSYASNFVKLLLYRVIHKG